MARFIFTSSFVLTFLFSNICGFSQDRTGLVSQIAVIKCSAESNLIRYFSFSNKRCPKDGNDSLQMLTYYNNIYLILNPLICQIEADMSSRNSTCLFLKLDKFLKNNSLNDNNLPNKKIKFYLAGLKKAYSADSLFKCKVDEYFNQTSNSKSLTAITSLIGIASTVSDIFEAGTGALSDLEDIRKNKVNTTVAILEKLKLSPTFELYYNIPVISKRK
jgi:hypothetical protein